MTPTTAPAASATVTLDERDAQAVLLVRAFEEADEKGALLSARAREEARPPQDVADAPAFLASRARGLLDRLRRRVDGLDAVLAATRVRVPLPGVLWLLALLVGVSVNALGPARRVQLLNLPLVGLVVFNVGVYVLLLAAASLRRLRGGRSVRRRPWLVGWARRLATWVVRTRRPNGAPSESVAALAVGRFLSSWGACAAPLWARRIGAVLHLGAAALVLGAVVGIYLRGLAVEFRVTWESTFLGAESVGALLRVVLAPGLALLDVDLPALEPLRAPSDGPAALWLHLYALSALVWVVFPRCALALWEQRSAARLARSVPLNLGAGYFRRLLSAVRGEHAAVRVVPYSYRLPPRARDALKSLLLDVFGGRASVEVQVPTDYGEDPSLDQGEGGTEQHVVVVFSLAQTPEAEVHGRFLEALVAHGRLLVVIDDSGYRVRLVEDVEQRLSERRRAWDRVVKEAGCVAAHLDLGEATGPEQIEVLVEASTGDSR